MNLPIRLPQPLRGGMLAGSLAIAAGTGAAQLVGIAAQPFLTRLYTPADYGAFSIAIGILFVISSVTSLRYEFAIALPRDDDQAANLVGSALLINGGMSLLSGVLLLSFGPALLTVTGASVLASFAWLLAVAQFAMGVNNILINWAVRTKAYSMISLNRLIQALVLSPLQILLGLMAVAAPGLLIGAVASSFAGATRLARGAWRTHAESFRRISFAGMKTMARRYRRFPAYSSPSALISAIGVRAPVLLLVPLYGAEVGGQYFLAERLLYLPMVLVASSVAHAFDAEGAELVRRKDVRGLKVLFLTTTRSLGLIGLVPAVLIAAIAPFATGPVFGDAWEQAGLYITVLMPMFLLAFIITATGNVLSFLERQPLHLVREVVRLGLLAGAVSASHAIGLSALAAIGVLSAAGCVVYALYWVVSWHAVSTLEPRAD